MTIILTVITIYVSQGQALTFSDWEEQSKTNKRLLPKYGQLPKTEDEKIYDGKFINEILKQEQFKGDRTAASNHMIQLGFNYMYRGDLKTAMYRFNQAYLLDSTNTDIYWGYGAIYMTFGQYELAKTQYQEGLSLNPSNTHLLTDYATYYMAIFYEYQIMPESVLKDSKERAKNYLDSTLYYLNKSYQIDPKDQNTTYKLSTTYWNKGDCENAWRFLDECRQLGGRPITEEYLKDLKDKCKKKKR